jgi:hypothetical protein
MSRRRKATDTTPFDTLRLEGSLFVPELLERAASGEASFQKESDYAVPKGLKLHDEYGRAFRIATATWQSFAPQMVRADLDAATVTRAFVTDFLRQCLGYTDLTPVGAPVQLGDRGFPVTALALGGSLPVIIAPHRLGLDDPDPRFAIIGSGSKRKSAHQLAQEFLNASRDSLWAIVTNGKSLRLLRDADTLTRPNFLEFDLETILRDDQHRYADFSALWRILHASRCSGGLRPSHESSSPSDCIWEKWKSEGHAQGLRVRDGLRDGVTQALLILGRGFLTQPDNTALRQRLQDGTLTTDNYFQQLLRLIYRSLFLFCAEERDLLHPPIPTGSVGSVGSVGSARSAAARQSYATGYSLRRLRNRALRQSAHDPHTDLWQSLRIVFRGLAGGQEKLALPALGGLFAETQCPDLDSAAITNRDLLSAMRELRWFFDKKTGKRSAIDYRNMGPEELGSVYESLLELVPTLDLPGRVFGFAGITDAASSSGNARKTTGSYYTPDSLVQELIKSALDPVIADRLDKAGRMANGEWRTEEEKQYAYQLISRLGCLEPGSGPRRENLRNDPGTPTGRTLRPDQPDAPCGSFNSLEHGGGLGTPLSGGVHQLSPQVQRQSDGTGDPIDHRGAGEAAEFGNCGGESRRTGDYREAVAEPGALPSAESLTAGASGEEANGELRTASGEDASGSSCSPLATHRSLEAFAAIPFATRYSLFACEALLRITVCDPSCGSGHFLLAAARRLAEKLAELRAPDGAVRPDDYRHALREVASRCLYGVDINPMAVELCRVALWLETVDPGKPLGFLNHHIRSGNSLLGTTPDLIAAGLPDDTFTAIEGDDKPACAELKKRNKAERAGLGPLFAKEEDSIREKLRQAATAIEAMDDSQPAALQQKEAAFLTNETAPEYRHAKLLADLWCAAFVIKKRSSEVSILPSRGVGILPSSRPVGVSPTSSESSIPDLQSTISLPEAGQLLHTEDDLFGQPVPAAKPTAKPKSSLRTDNFNPITPTGITTGTLRDYVQGKPLPEDLESEANQLASQYRFFHWHLAFPQVFAQGGFDCILGNPPWDKIQPEEEKFFASNKPAIALITDAKARKERIAALVFDDPRSFDAWIAYKRHIDTTCLFLSAGGLFRYAGNGNLNTYRLFTELSSELLANSGSSGLVVQSGIATDESGKELFHSFLVNRQLIRFWDFENREGFFPDVDSRFRFCLLTVSGTARPDENAKGEFAWQLQTIEEVNDTNRLIHLSAEDLLLFNPSSQTCPVFTAAPDYYLARLIYQRGTHVSVSTSDRVGEIDFLGELFNLTRDARYFVPRRSNEDHDALPLYEAKYIHQFDHHFATNLNGRLDAPTLENRIDSLFTAQTNRTVAAIEVRTRLAKRGAKSQWLAGFRDIARATDERTVIASVLPMAAVGNSINLILSLSASETATFIANADSFIFDFCARQKVGGTHVNIWIFKQLPAIPFEAYTQPCPWSAHPQSTIHDPPSLRDWLLPRVLELTYTAWDLEAFAADCGWSGPPFRWDEDRRFLLRCELDAAFFHLYLGSEDEWRQQPEALTRAFPTPRHAVSYIMDTFPIVKRKDESKHGTYRTKATILQIYDALAHSIATGTPYQSLLDPPPADPAVCHPPRPSLPDV